MTLKIEVTIPEEYVQGDHAATYLARAMAAIGFSRSVSLAMPAPALIDAEHSRMAREAADAPSAAVVMAADTTPVVQAEPVRERGKPAPGRGRRTKEEIAEDEAADKATVDVEAAAQISTGEERVDPADVAEQDAKDEAAEVEEHRKALTVDDLKSVMGGYVKKFGMEATQEDGPKIFTEALGAPPAGQPAWKVSLLDGDQERLAKAVDVWTKAVDLNPLKRALAGA